MDKEAEVVAVRAEDEAEEDFRGSMGHHLTALQTFLSINSPVDGFTLTT